MSRFFIPCFAAASLVCGGLFGTPGPARADESWNPFRQLSDDPAPPKRTRPASPPAADPAAVAPDGSYPPAATAGYGPAPWQSQPEAGSSTASQRPPEFGPVGPAGTLGPPVPERERGVERGELTPVMASDGSGLPYESWRGLDALAVEGHLGKIELPSKSPVLQSLLRRLFSADPGAGTSPADGRLSSVRADALYRLGLGPEALAAAARADVSDPRSLLTVARIEVAAGDTARACDRAKSLIGRKGELAKPLQLELLVLTGFCAAANGNAGGAGLAAELIREDRLEDHGALAALDAASSGGAKGPLRTTKPVSDLLYRLYAMGGGLEVADVIQRGEPALLARLARDSSLEPALRIAAAEAAARANALKPGELAEAYRSGATGSLPADGPAGERRTSPVEQAMHRAGLFKAAEMERTPFRKTRLTRTLLDDAKRAGLYWPVLEALGPVADVIQPVPELGWFAETGVEIGLASGNLGMASRWVVLGGSVPGDGGLRHWQALIDLADVSAARQPGPERGRSLTAVSELAVRGRLHPDLLHRLATILDALDYDVPLPLWEAASRVQQPTGGHLPVTGVLSELQDAAKAKQFGRTLLLVSRTFGPQGPEGANMIALGDGIRALKRAGLEGEARRASLEALFGQWPRGAIP